MKSDVFGRVLLQSDDPGPVVMRDLGGSRWWARALARHLLSREAAALLHLQELSGVPRLLRRERDMLRRSWIEAEPMHRSHPTEEHYFRAAARLLRQLHRRGVAHNDLAKEPNWLVTPAGEPAIVDFQLAVHSPSRGRLFRMLAREDLRHLLKHKRTYCPSSLTRREKRILDNPTLLSRIWMKTGKRLYLFITRRMLRWEDREGAADR